MKTLPPFWPSQHYKKFLGTVLGLCLSTFSNAQDAQTPLSTPSSTEYPGILQTFETLLQIDQTKFKNKFDSLTKSGKILSDSKTVNQLELEPDFLNSIILHSNSGYVRMAGTDKCRFYDAIITDLLKSAEGKIKNVMVTYLTRNGQRESAILSKKDFLSNVVNQECPESVKLIEKFQIKTLDRTIGSTIFEIPTNRDQCRITHLSWQNNPQTPYFCQLFEYIREAKNGEGDPKDLKQRQTVAKIIDGKLTIVQKDYLENLCLNLDNEEEFCKEFLNVSFWNKIAGGQKSPIYINDICRQVLNTKTLSPEQIKVCLNRLKREQDLCLYGSDKLSSLSPHLDCETLSIALNHSSLKSDYNDCPGNSDQLIATNFSRILLGVTSEEPKKFNGPCSAISAGETMLFNDRFDNDENWTLEACYFDKIKEREVCSKTFFGEYSNHPLSYTNVVAGILKETRGAEKSLTCAMVSSKEYNPLFLQYKNGCQIIYEANRCFISECEHKIIYNDRIIDFISVKNRTLLEYFPLNIKTERFTLHSLLKNDFKQPLISINNLTSIKSFFKTSKKNLLYGIGCAEDLLPSFFKIRAMNHCSPLPFIIDGIIKEGEQPAFVVRTSVDSLQAPRIMSWSTIYSGVKSYQRYHPLKLWTLYGLN